MIIQDLPTYQEIEQKLNKSGRVKHLLFGNGFSMAYDYGIFSYNALSNFIENIENDLLKKLFDTLNTKNFELIMQQLDNFCEIAAVFSTDEKLVEKVQLASSALKNSLIDAVKALHPEHVFTIPEEKSRACYSFLHSYLSKNGFVFSTNYDLLLYWVMMRNGSEFAIDGFGRELENEDEVKKGGDAEFSELRWGKHKNSQNIFYVHGALPIFDSGVDIIKEEYDSQHYLLKKISSRMENKQYPIFVTAGTATEKLTHIMHNKYLSYCFERLSTITGSLVTFGFNFGDYDTHIIEAINKATKFRKDDGGKLLSIYIGVYSEADLEHINGITKKFKCKVNMYNARTLNVWGNMPDKKRASN
jgi:hypothetical protein